MSIQTDLQQYNDDWSGFRVDAESVKKETFSLKQPEIESDRERVYNEIASNGGITIKELAEKWGCPPNCISGRFSELFKSNRIVKYDKKYLPNYKGKMYPHTVWRALR